MNGSIRIPAVRAVVLHEGRFLLAQHHNYLPGTIGKWGLPGGRIEATDADLVAALRRELHEEFAMTADIIGFVAMYMYRDRSQQLFPSRPHKLNVTAMNRSSSSVAQHAYTPLAGRTCSSQG